MRKLSALLLSLLLCLLLPGCTDGGKISTEAPEHPYSTEVYDPFAQVQTDAQTELQGNFGFGLVNPPDGNRFAYQASMTLDFWLENAAQAVDFGFLLFVNGVQQTYRFADEPQQQTVKIIRVGAGERRVFSVTFSPAAAEHDGSFVLSWGFLFHPEFVPDSPTAAFGHSCRLNAASLPLDGASEQIAVQKTVQCGAPKPVPEALLDEMHAYYDIGSSASVAPDIRTIKIDRHQSTDTPNALYADDAVQIRVLGAQRESTWRISMYCNHEIVPAFDGAYYLDVQAVPEMLSEYTVPMSVVQNADQPCNCVYFIAAEVGADAAHDPFGTHPLVMIANPVPVSE